MDANHPLARKLLQAFDAPVRAVHDGTLSLTALGDAAELRPVADALIARGWLRPARDADSYIRTEDGRLAIAAASDVTLYTRPGCHLCEKAKADILPLLRRAGASLREVNIDADPVLRDRYNLDVPVIFLGARKVAKYRVDLPQFKRQLDEARGR